jgi:hypothetical protein
VTASRAQQGVSQAKGKKQATTSGFQSATIGLLLHDISGFDVIRDCIPDWMHEVMVLTKQFMHVTYDMLLYMLEKVQKQHVSGKKFDYANLLLMFRRDIPSPYSRSRRIPWGLSHSQLKSWTAEECLVWIRVTWPHFFQELRAYVRSSVPSLHKQDLLDELAMFQTLWQHMSDVYASLSHLDGMQGSPAAVREQCVNLVDFVANSTLKGRPFLGDAYCTYTLHVMLHLVQYVLWWGNLPEHWCFLYERCAGVFTRLLRGYNHSSDKGASSWLMDRTHIKLVSSLKLAGSLANELAALGCTELAGSVEEEVVQAPLVIEQCVDRSIVVQNGFDSKGPQGAVWSALWDRAEHCTLGGLHLRGRSRDDVRLAPWERDLSPNPGHGIAFHALWLHVPGVNARQLFVSDGCARLQRFPGDLEKLLCSPALGTWQQGGEPLRRLVSRWNLVGVVLDHDVVQPMQPDDPCKTVRLTTGLLQLQVVPVEWVSSLVVLTRLNHSPGFCCLIEPAGYMVQRTIGAFETKTVSRGDTRMKYKLLKFVPMSELPETILPPSCNTDPSDELQGSLEETGDGSWDLLPSRFHPVAQFVLDLKPTGIHEPIGPRKGPLVLKEILIGGIYFMWQNVINLRTALDLGTDLLNFTDLGSGVGNTVMVVGLIEPRIGNVIGIELNHEHHELARSWVHSVADTMPMSSFYMDKLLDGLVCGDMTDENTCKRFYEDSDVIFVNNYLFCDDTKARKNVDKRPLNAVLMVKLEAWATKIGVVVVTTAPIAWTLNGPFIACSNIEFPADAFSWTDSPVLGYVAVRQPQSNSSRFIRQSPRKKKRTVE